MSKNWLSLNLTDSDLAEMYCIIITFSETSWHEIAYIIAVKVVQPSLHN